MEKKAHSRRGFLTTGAAIGTASLFSSGSAAAASKSGNSPSKKIKVGVMGVGRGSFMSYSWADIIASTTPKPKKLVTLITVQLS